MRQVAVVSMYLMSGLSGSDSADVAAVGTVLRNVPEQGPKGEGAAVMAASAIMGASVPPSIAMLVLGSVTHISIAALFVGGLIPAAVIMVCLMILNYVKARRNGDAPAPRVSARVLGRTLLASLVPLSLPVILFGGILSGIATPTEVSSFAVVYSILISVFVYRALDWRGFVEVVIDSAVLTGMILFILAAASSFSWALTIGNLPQRLVAVMASVGDSGAIFIIGSIVLMIVLSSLLEGLPALNILAPMLVPLAARFGFGELHYGMVLLIAMGLGVFIPPAGVGFYVCCSVMRAEIGPASRAMLPYLAVLIVGLLLVAFVPWFTNVLPRSFDLII
jgi:tripartite ATP-independent transporter DctM subunit